MKRKTSIELLRVISMLLVVAFHWELHGYGDQIYCSPISVNQIFSFFIGSWGSMGVDLFFIISSYFLVKSDSIKISKIISLIIKVSIYGTTIVLLANALGIVPFNAIATITSVLGVFAYQYWFITVYLIVYIMFPCLNKLINSLSLKYYAVILFTLIYATYVNSFVFGNELLGRLACGFTIYFIIGFLEKYNEYNIFERFKLSGTVFAIMGVIVLEVMLSYLGTYINPVFYGCIRRIQITQSPIMLVTALFIFYLIKNANMGFNRMINFLGKYSVGAYMLHGGGVFIKDYLWDGLFKAGYYYERMPKEYILRYIYSVLILFIAGIICEFIYVNVINKGIMFILMKLKFNEKISID